MASHNRQEEALMAYFKIHYNVQVYGNKNINQNYIHHKMKGGLNLGDASYKLVQLDMQHAHRE
jgi:capsule polysaccharide modification protein KpsS